MSSPPPAPGEDRSPALALANTMIVSRARAVDLVPNAEAVSGWLTAHGLPPAAVTADDVVALSVLRGAVREVFEASIAGTAPSTRALLEVNRAARGALPPQLTWTRDGPRPEAARAEFAAVLSLLAADAIELVTGDRASELRRCPARGCIRFFLQNHGRRRWCSRACGDRVRVARHYERRRLNA